LPAEVGPCFDAADPKLWPVKPEAHVCGTDGLLYPSKNALECAKTRSENKIKYDKMHSVFLIIHILKIISGALVSFLELL
jgi:Kazal-type serine protease inhibitor domain